MKPLSIECPVLSYLESPHEVLAMMAEDRACQQERLAQIELSITAELASKNMQEYADNQTELTTLSD